MHIFASTPCTRWLLCKLVYYVDVTIDHSTHWLIAVCCSTGVIQEEYSDFEAKKARLAFSRNIKKGLAAVEKSGMSSDDLGKAT